MKKRFKTVAVGLSAILLLSSSVLPSVSSVVYANEINAAQMVSVGEIDKDALVRDILVDVKSELLPELELVQPEYQSRGVAGLLATLIAKYGIVYVKRQLPKIIYRHVAKYIGYKVGEATFVRIFGNIVNWGTGTAIEQVLARSLIAVGVDSNTANTVASVTVLVASWFV